MQVRNKTDHGVFVNGHGVIPPGEQANVRDDDPARALIRAGVLAKVQQSSSSTDKNGGDDS